MDKEYLPGIILGLIIGVVVFGWVIYPEYVDSQKPIKNTTVFHVTLADPALYDCNMRLPLFPSDCKYTETVFLEEGMYEFRFVLNGDSPQKLEVRLDPAGETGFSQKYVLVGNLVEVGLSSWYTWEYHIDPVDAYWADKRTCESCVSINKWKAGQAKITINPMGNVNGPVSIELVLIK